MSQKRGRPILRSGTWVLVDPSKFDSPDRFTKWFVGDKEIQVSYEWDEYIRQALAFVGEHLCLVWDRIPSAIATSLSGVRMGTTDGKVVRMYSSRAVQHFEEQPVKRRFHAFGRDR